MFNAAVSALFRSVLNEVGVDEPTHEARINVVPKPLAGVSKGEMDADNSAPAERKLVLPPPSMWN